MPAAQNYLPPHAFYAICLKFVQKIQRQFAVCDHVYDQLSAGRPQLVGIGEKQGLAIAFERPNAGLALRREQPVNKFVGSR